MVNEKSKAKLLLHACCAPCLTSVYEQIKDEYEVTVFWFNPNIHPIEEYQKRFEELEKYCKIINIPLVVGDKMPEDSNNYELLVRGLENEPEGGKRCRVCIKMRLLYTAKFAQENNFDVFGTTLTVSPHKNSYAINNIGKEVELSLRGVKLATKQSKSKIAALQNIARNDNVIFIDRDFKKNNGYLRSIELCKKYGIYRQNYCGCQYSVRGNG